MLGGNANPAEEQEKGAITMYLYEAIRKVLEDNNRHLQTQNQPMTIQEIAAEINRRQLFRKKDGSLVRPDNVGLRAVNDAVNGVTLDVLVRIRE